MANTNDEKLRKITEEQKQLLQKTPFYCLDFYINEIYQYTREKGKPLPDNKNYPEFEGYFYSASNDARTREIVLTVKKYMEDGGFRYMHACFEHTAGGYWLNSIERITQPSGIIEYRVRFVKPGGQEE